MLIVRWCFFHAGGIACLLQSRWDYPASRDDRTSLRCGKEAFMENTIRTRYCKECPSDQTALDIFKGFWKSALPAELGLRTGDEAHFFQDPRVLWFQSLLPSGFSGLDILELGPFEGYDTYLFGKLGAKTITSIEANNINFLKCVLLKDVLNLDVKFLHGDFVEFLKNSQKNYDVVWASGILYHSERPIDLLSQIARHTNRLFIWTHYFDKSVLSNFNKAYFDSAKNQRQMFSDRMYTLHYRSYLISNPEDNLPLHYEGGQQPFAYWMSLEDIYSVLRSLGFNTFRTQEEGAFSGMPYIGMLAERS
jgi:hypothetical protein